MILNKLKNYIFSKIKSIYISIYGILEVYSEKEDTLWWHWVFHYTYTSSLLILCDGLIKKWDSKKKNWKWYEVNQ